IGKYYLVKEKDAHLWVEAYIDKQWIRLDPTPPVRNQVINTIERPSKLNLLFDSINYYYTAFVVNYDFSKQMDFYRGIKEKISKIPDIKLHLKKEIVVSTFLLLLLIIGLVFVYNYLTKSYEERLL
ncbi:MAG: transglutaminase domain-containing protein, partial [Candidatus Hydrothermales bacterium]